MKNNIFETPTKLLIISSILYLLIFFVFIYFVTTYHPPVFKQIDIEIVNLKMKNDNYYEGDLLFVDMKTIINKEHRVKIFQNNKQFFIQINPQGDKINIKKEYINKLDNKDKVNAIIFIESKSDKSLYESILNKKL